VHKGRLVSLQPLWAAATKARDSRGAHANSLAMLEPDALTVLGLKEQSAVRVMSWPGKHDAAEARTRLADGSARTEESDQLKGVVMAFGREPAKSVWPDGPTVWAQHWSKLP